MQLSAISNNVIRAVINSTWQCN